MSLAGVVVFNSDAGRQVKTYSFCKKQLYFLPTLYWGGLTSSK